MKLKTLGRVAGALDAVACSVIGYFIQQTSSSINYSQLKDNILSDNPLELKLLSGLGLGMATSFLALTTPVVAAGIADGIYDVYRGTHHYLGCRIWQKLTRNPETKQKIDGELENQLIKIGENH